MTAPKFKKLTPRRLPGYCHPDAVCISGPVYEFSKRRSRPVHVTWATGRRWVTRNGSFYLCMLTLVIGLSVDNSRAADAIPGEQWCTQTIQQIRFEGNDVTKPAIIERELVQQAGQSCSLDDIIDGIQNIQDLGLFNTVSAELSISDMGLVLTYNVDEKIFFLPLPRFSRTSDGELRLGAQLRWDNFSGRLHQLKLTSEKRQENDGQGRTGYVHSLEYSVPRFLNSRYGMHVTLATERRNTELASNGFTYGEALRESKYTEIRLARWANKSGGVQGLSYYAGIGIENRDYELQTGELGPYQGGQALSLLSGFDIQRVHQDTFRRRGMHHGLALRIADKVAGADFRYSRLDIRFRWYKALAPIQTNLNIQLRFGLSTGAPFGEKSYHLGGGEVLRGMRPGSLEGNILAILNVEYLRGLFAYPHWRWLIFTDIGNVYSTNKVDLSQQHMRVGAGLRWKLTALTNTDLRLDVAWDPRRRKLTPYLSTSLTF